MFEIRYASTMQNLCVCAERICKSMDTNCISERFMCFVCQMPTIKEIRLNENQRALSL